jgi:hypothetical protein
MTLWWRKYTDLSWDGDDTSTPVGGGDSSAKVREPTPPPQTEVSVEATLEEATLVEGMYTLRLVGIKHSSRNRRN